MAAQFWDFQVIWPSFGRFGVDVNGGGKRHYKEEERKGEESANRWAPVEERERGGREREGLAQVVWAA